MSISHQIPEIPLARLEPSPFNPRETFIGLQELADNIKSEGRPEGEDKGKADPFDHARAAGGEAKDEAGCAGQRGAEVAA